MHITIYKNIIINQFEIISFPCPSGDYASVGVSEGTLISPEQKTDTLFTRIIWDLFSTKQVT